MSVDEPEVEGRPKRIDPGEILEKALAGLDEVTDELATTLMEIDTAGPGRAQRIQEAIDPVRATECSGRIAHERRAS